MPTPPAFNSTVPWQVLPNGVQQFVQQMNFGQMIGQVTAWNPDCEAQAPIWINEAVKKVLDRRTWFGLFTKGQIVVPQATTAGQAIVELGNNLVTGVNTTWTQAVVGQQFRIGYNNPIYTITDVDTVGQVLHLELAWGATGGTFGYWIVQNYVNFGPNIKYLKNIVNMQLGRRMWVHANQDWMNAVDPWRQNQNWPWAVAPLPLSPEGNYLAELYPASWIQQAFPFLAYTIPPKLVNDLDTLPAYMRCDVIILEPIAKALTWRGPKKNPYYDPTTAKEKRQEFREEVMWMESQDENLYRTNLSLPFEDVPMYSPGGALWDASHAVMADSSAYGDY